jgi:hypothetical protein
MTPSPLYRPERLASAYQLRYTWTGWPSGALLPRDSVLDSLKPLWEKDDALRLLEHCCWEHEVQLAFSARPAVGPVFVAARAKGRLQHALREADPGFSGFSRKVAIRSVGNNTTADVEAYIARQVGTAQFVDPRFRQQMEEFTVLCPEVDLAQPSESARGRYWYNLHVVLVVVERYRIVDRQRLRIIRDGCFQIAANKGHAIAALSVMPDHVHIALRGNIAHTPQEIALGFLNNLAYLLGQIPMWNEGFYAGTFSEYDMGAIRARARRWLERRAGEAQ